MADEEKKPPAFDPDKTMVEMRRPPQKSTEPADSDRTIVTPSRPQPPPAAGDAAKNPVASRPPAAPPEADRTVVTPARGAPPEAERTMMMPASAAGAPRPVVPSGPADVQIVALSGPQRGKQFPIHGDGAVIGSNPTCNVVVPGLESLHARISKREDGWEIQNLGSPGSLIAGRRVAARAALASNDLLKIGEVVFRFVQIGEMFSAEYDESDLRAAGIGALLNPQAFKENPIYLVVAALVVVLLAVLLWPSQLKKVAVKAAGPSSSEQARQKEVEGLLAAGEVLFNSGKLVAPADQPDAENAYGKFNDVLALDPGNDTAKSWLKKIDAELDKTRRARDEAEKQRLAEERARKERQRQELEKKVSLIVAEGDEYFDKGQVTEPVGTNALAKYREALKVDPESPLAQARVQRAVYYYVQKGDDLRDRGDSWAALENYRKASRATQGRDDEVEKRVAEVEGQLRSGMSGTNVKLVIYKDDRGQLFVLDDMDKVPARYRDRAVEVNPAPSRPGGR